MGRIAIACPICQGIGFNAEREAPAPVDVVTCEHCGLKLSYGFLLRKLVPVSDDRKAPRTAVRKPAIKPKPPLKRKLHKAKRKAKRRAA